MSAIEKMYIREGLGLSQSMNKMISYYDENDNLVDSTLIEYYDRCHQLQADEENDPYRVTLNMIDRDGKKVWVVKGINIEPDYFDSYERARLEQFSQLARCFRRVVFEGGNTKHYPEFAITK